MKEETASVETNAELAVPALGEKGRRARTSIGI
jgi:hypothetical protein